MPNASIAHAFQIHAWGFITTLRPVKCNARWSSGVVLLIGAMLLIGGCASTAKPPVKKDQTAAHERQGYKHAETAYLAGDYPQALRILQPLADEGDAEAQYILGYMYYYGQGVVSDPQAAREWIGKSANQGHDKARIALSRFETAEAVQEQAPTPSQTLMSSQAPVASNMPDTMIESQMPELEMDKSETVEPQMAEPQMTEPQAPQQPEPVMSPKPAKPAVAPAMAETSSAPQPGSYEWVLAQSPERVTIQLLATHDKRAAQDLIRRHGLTADVAVFQFVRKGETWFSVIYGSFASISEAKAAVLGLPSALRKQSHWIRGFSGIQDIIVAPGR